MSSINDGMSVSSGPKIDVKQVGYAKVELGKRTAEVCKLPDVVKATLDKLADPPCPREQMRGQRNSKHYNEDGRSFRGSEYVSPEGTEN